MNIKINSCISNHEKKIKLKNSFLDKKNNNISNLGKKSLLQKMENSENH